MKFFSYDSAFSQLLLKICWACYLNLLWFVCCIPVFTAGASTTALYYTTLKIARGEDVPVGRTFFRAFRENFRQGTVLWLILLAAGALLGGDAYVVYHLRASSAGAAAVFWTLILAVLIAAAIVYVIVLMYVFPLTASVTNTNWAMLKNSFFVGVRYLFCTILVFAIHFAVFFISVAFFFPLVIFGEGLVALLSSYLLKRVIAAVSYDPNADDGEDDGDEGAEDSPDGPDGSGL